MKKYNPGFALLGGTFDPVHVGHLRMAIEARELLSIDCVRLVPCYIPSHRDQPETSARERMEMLQLAITGLDGLEIDDIECQRKGPSYTVDTLKYYRETEGRDCPLVLLMGMDAFATLHEWHDWQSIGELANVAVIDRPGYAQNFAPSVEEWLQPRLVDDPNCLVSRSHGLVCYLGLTQLDISASMIRNLVRNQSSLDYLLPQPVIEYIADHHLYQFL